MQLCARCNANALNYFPVFDTGGDDRAEATPQTELFKRHQLDLCLLKIAEVFSYTVWL